MGLVLTIRVKEDLYVDHEQFILRQIVSPEKVCIVRTRDGAVFEVTTAQRTLIDSEVEMQVGGYMTTKVAGLVVDAPRTKIILLGAKYRTRNILLGQSKLRNDGGL